MEQPVQCWRDGIENIEVEVKVSLFEDGGGSEGVIGEDNGKRAIQADDRGVRDGAGDVEERMKVRKENDEETVLFAQKGGGAYKVIYVVAVQICGWSGQLGKYVGLNLAKKQVGEIWSEFGFLQLLQISVGRFPRRPQKRLKVGTSGASQRKVEVRGNACVCIYLCTQTHYTHTKYLLLYPQSDQIILSGLCRR